jgi:hypothetical protein
VHDRSRRVSTSIAYWLWGRLLRDYPAAQVVPFALLVPFVGSAASSVVFGETFGPLRLAGMVTVVGGIAVMLLSKRPRSVRSESLRKTSSAKDRVRPHVAFASDRLRHVRHVMFFTPGPNNIMLLSSGLTYGFRPPSRTSWGSRSASPSWSARSGLGLGTIFIAYPVLQTILKYAGSPTWSIWPSISRCPSRLGGAGQQPRPMTFWGAAMFQWVNAKGWVMVIGTITAYAAIAAYPWNIAIQVG